MDFLRKASAYGFNHPYEVERVSFSGNPIITGYMVNNKVLTVVNRPILDEKEKEYLSSVIRPFRKEIGYIRKNDFIGEDECEYIEIVLEKENIIFPNFEKGTMYKNMKLNKKYTVKELGL